MASRCQILSCLSPDAKDDIKVSWTEMVVGCAGQRGRKGTVA